MRDSSHQPMRTFRFLGLSYLGAGSRSALVPRAVAIADQIPRLLLGRRSVAPVPDLSEGWITVCKPDHLGDVLMATQFLSELRRQRPGLRIQLVVGSWSLPLARLLEAGDLCHETVVLDTTVLNRSGGVKRKLARHLATHRTALAQVRRRAPRCFVDLRALTSNGLLLARQAGVPFRVGFGLRGFGYTLDRLIPFSATRTTGQLLMDALPEIGLEGVEYSGPVLPASGAQGGFADVEHLMAEIGPRPFVTLHATSPDAARRVSLEVWRPFLEAYKREATIVALGTAHDRETYAPLRAASPGARWIDLTGRTSFEQMVEIARRCAGGVVIDSVVAHILLAFRKPTALLMTPRASYRFSYPEHCPSVRFVESTAPPQELDDAAAETRHRALAPTGR